MPLALEHLREAMINQSLSNLALVINRLADLAKNVKEQKRSMDFIPFRSHVASRVRDSAAEQHAFKAVWSLKAWENPLEEGERQRFASKSVAPRHVLVLQGGAGLGALFRGAVPRAAKLRIL